MKHFIFLLTIFMSMVVIKAFAYDAVIGGIYYNLDSSKGTAEVTYRNNSGNNYSGAVVIPETIVYSGDTYCVTLIGERAFCYCSSLTAITIPNSVNYIRAYAFFGCSGLTSVTIPNRVPSIGERAFSGCSGLTSITIPNSVQYIGEWAFYGCSSLTSINIPSSVINIGAYAFSGCNGLTSVHITNLAMWCDILFEGETSNPLYYAHHLFMNGKEIKNLVVPNNVTRIAKYAFYGCSGLTSVTITNNVTAIEGSAFEGCSSLIKVVLNSNAIVSKSYSGTYSFWDIFGKQVEEYIIGNDITAIGDFTFRNTKLNTLIVGTGVLSIGNLAFIGATRPVKTIWLPNTPPERYTYAQGSVNYVANSQYSGLNDMKEYKFLSSMFEVDGIRYVPVSPSERTCDAIDCVYDESAENITIGESVTNKGISLKIQNIQPYLCYGNTNIKSVNIEFGYNGDVPSYSFYGCTGIVSANISNQGSIAEKAFYGSATSNPATFIINNNGNIGASAFEGCTGIISATIKNQGYIGQKAFYGSATSNSATFTITNHGSIGTSAFEGCIKITKLTIDNKGSIGESCFSGCTSLQTTTLGNNIPNIGASAFKSCSNLGSIVIPDAVRTLGKSTFKGCSSMTSVNIGDGVKLINDSTFSGCSSLKDVEIGNSVSSIAASAFSGCITLPKIQIPQNVTVIGNNVFSGCTGLKTVIMADRETEGELNLGSNGSNPIFVDCPLDSVYIGRNISYSTSSSYGYSPFYRNTSLRSVTITDKETEISENEFYGCTNLQNVKIGDGVTSIGNWAFSGCSSLKNFSFGTQVKTIGKEAFSDCTAVTAISSKAQTPPTCGSQALDDINKWECTLYVPEGHVADYQSTDQWKEFFFIEEGDIPVYIRGDVNGDGVVNGTDIQAIINLIVESLYDEKCDVNEDGRVNGTDIQEVINIIVNAE